jgi:hypothetical protein
MTWMTSETFIRWKVVVAVDVAADEAEEVVMEQAANGSASTMATRKMDMAMMTDMDMDTMMGMVEDTIHPIVEEDLGEAVAEEVADEEEVEEEAEVPRKGLLLMQEVKRKLLEVATPTPKVAPVPMLLDILRLWSKHPMVDVEAMDAAFIEEGVVVAEEVVGLMLST